MIFKNKVVVNENGGSSGGEQTQSLTFQGGATVDLPCRLDGDNHSDDNDPGCQRVLTLSGRGLVEICLPSISRSGMLSVS